MYCSHCGSAASGNFCSDCGSALVSAADVANWEQEIRYDRLVRLPHIRAAIDEQARRSPKRLSGEQFLALSEGLLPGGAPLQLLASILQPLYASWGIGTGKQRQQAIAAPPGRVLLRLLCSLARNGQTLRQVRQASDGCAIEAALPSDMWALESDLLVAVRANANYTEVQAATKIKGQLFDWGKSSRCLERLLADLQHDVGLMQLPPADAVATLRVA